MVSRLQAEGVTDFHAWCRQHPDFLGQLPTVCNEWRHVLLRVGFPSHASDAVSAISCFTDVTGQRQLEEPLRRSQRMEAIGQMTGGIAHDFNNLLTVILGNAELLSEELVAEPRLRALADMTLQAAERGAELIRRLLAFARRQPLCPSSPPKMSARAAAWG